MLEAVSSHSLGKASSGGTACGMRNAECGMLGTVNGVGDLAASVIVGTLWTAVSPIWAFGYAALFMGLGGIVVYRLR